MASANELVQTIKKASLDAIEASKPVNVYFGVVKSIHPLTVNVEQKLKLGESQLILTRNVTDYDTMVTVEWDSEEEEATHNRNDLRQPGSDEESPDGSMEAPSGGHFHRITGEKRITIRNGLAVGEEVILVRQQKGQKFIVLDRIGK